MSVYEATHIISSKKLSSFDDSQCRRAIPTSRPIGKSLVL